MTELLTYRHNCVIISIEKGYRQTVSPIIVVKRN